MLGLSRYDMTPNGWRAAGSDRSLESEVRRILACAVEDDMAAKRKAFRALAARLRRKADGNPHPRRSPPLNRR